MRGFVLGAVALLAALLAGCDYNCYELEITPRGEALQRKLTCWHESGSEQKKVSPLAEKELDRIQRLYERREGPDKSGKAVFSGRFTGTTPADVGGAGSYTPFTSPMGSAAAYVERFRGNDDLEAALRKRNNAADQLADLILGWFQAELGSQASFAPLKKFINEDLRQDLKNVSLYSWTGDVLAGPTHKFSAEFVVRAGQYLQERGYLAPGDLPLLARCVTTDDRVRLLHHVQRLVARKMGVPSGEPIPDGLAFLGGPERAEASLAEYIRSTDVFKKRLAAWRAERTTNPKAKEPQPNDLVSDLASDSLLPPDLLGPADTLQVKLACPQQPFETNGRWDEATACVVWSATLGKQPALPTLFYAFWSLPDRRFQESHFGQVVLSGDKLAQYILWYHGLTPEEGRQWDRLLAECKPGPDLIARIDSFRFRGESKPEPGKSTPKHPSLADTPRDLILPALRPR